LRRINIDFKPDLAALQVKITVKISDKRLSAPVRSHKFGITKILPKTQLKLEKNSHGIPFI